MSRERVDLDAVQAEATNDLDLPEDWMHAVVSLVAELRVARTQLGWVRTLLDASPFGPTRADAVNTLFQIRQALTDDQHTATQDPGP